jgi:hypothetical protein
MCQREQLDHGALEDPVNLAREFDVQFIASSCASGDLWLGRVVTLRRQLPLRRVGIRSNALHSITARCANTVAF